ncbi:MAG: efflux RND transporter periplasmic adaptor subunit [Candidatus Anammoximicrobium sp.]|nr:efflux RND transporter periplasmic adaptor subunit [Candidatus Anammoximicrobium sp.]
MNESRQRWLVLLASLGFSALLLGGLAGGWAVWRTLHEQLQDPNFLNQQLERVAPQGGEAAKPAPPALIRVSVAERKKIQPQRSIIGRLVEVRKVTVASEVTGKIVDLPVDQGTPVSAGQTVLARVDDVWSRLAAERSKAQVASAKARRASAQAQLAYQQAELRRETRLSQTNVVTDSELESRQASVQDLEAKAAEAEAAQAEAEVALAEETERMSRSVILAPFDGTVVEKRAELGGYVSPGNPIVDIVSRGQVDAQLMVPESMVNLIELEQSLPIRIDALAEEVRGTVVSVTPYGPGASRTFPVLVRLDDQGGRIKVGMSVTASIATDSQREALVVSRDAVLVRPDGSTVWVAVPAEQSEDIRVQPVPVTISARMPTEYAIEPETDTGRRLLTAGTKVVIEGAERLTPGQQIRIVSLQER